MRRVLLRLGAAILLIGPIGPGAALAPTGRAAPVHFADAEDLALVAQGKAVYRARCASCHGRALQGQPLWQLDDAFAGRRAPAQDETGHSWQHSDEALFHITKYGRFPDAPADRAAAMPGFAGTASDREILAALAFIKARWPVGLRVAQATLNPGMAGLPPQSAAADWTLPTNCLMTGQRVLGSAAIGPVLSPGTDRRP